MQIITKILDVVITKPMNWIISLPMWATVTIILLIVGSIWGIKKLKNYMNGE